MSRGKPLVVDRCGVLFGFGRWHGYQSMVKLATSSLLPQCRPYNRIPAIEMENPPSGYHRVSMRCKTFEVVGRVGLEPTTNGLKGRCSTTELPTPTGELQGSWR